MIKVHSKDSATSGSTKLTVNASSILELTLIDDKDNDITQDELIKYVNLPVDKKFIDVSNGTITGTHQLGDDVWCKVKFRKPGNYTFDIVLRSDNAVVYTQPEKSRNRNFICIRAKKISGSTDSYGVILVKGEDIFVNAAGGNTYTLKAECNGENKVTCRTKILTKRMLFYSEVKMRNLDGTGFLSSINNDISNLVDEYKNHHIELIRSFETSIAYMPNIDTNSQKNFIGDVESAYNNSPNNKNLDPFCMAITYVGQLAKKSSAYMFNFDIPVGPSEGPAMIDVTSNNMYYESLWHNIDYPDDDRNEWYISCTYTMTKNVNGVAILSSPIVIPPDKCTAVSIGGNPNNCRVVRVDVSQLPSGVADITLKVHIVSMMKGGVSYLGTNVICLCTKVWWGEFSAAEQNITVIHEVGHIVGMVPDGTGTSLDRGSNYYIDRGHSGPHCHSGISHNVTTDYTSVNHRDATCIMYGGISVRRIKFCDDCASKIKKVDLTKGVSL